MNQVGVELNPRLDHWEEKVKEAEKILRKGDEIGKRMEVVGEDGVAIDDMVIFLKSELYEFCYLQQNAFDKEDAYCPLERQIEMFRLIQQIFGARFPFDVHDAARSFFLNLQNELKNMNFLSFHSQKYHDAMAAIELKIKEKTAP